MTVKNLFITAVFLAFGFAVQAQDIERLGNGFKVTDDGVTVEVTSLSPEIVRVSKYAAPERPQKYSPSVIMTPQDVKVKVTSRNGVVTLSNSVLKVSYDMSL